MKKIFLTFFFSVFSLVSMQHYDSLRLQLHDHSPVDKPVSTISEKQSFRQNIRAFLHDGTIVSNCRVLDDKIPTTPLSRYDDYPGYLLESYKNGNKISPQQKKTVIMYLYQQIKNNDDFYGIWDNENMPYVWRILIGKPSMPLRYALSKLTVMLNHWEEDLNELAITETTETC